MKKFSHTDKEGRARMVDIGEKPDQRRVARAEGFIRLQGKTMSLIRENEMKKGDVLTLAEVAGVQAAKQTQNLIPLCHTLLLDKIEVKASLQNEGIRAESELWCTGKTGVEMEALTAVSVALLTVYDMCKAVDKEMRIENIHLTHKSKHEPS